MERRDGAWRNETLAPYIQPLPTGASRHTSAESEESSIMLLVMLFVLKKCLLHFLLLVMLFVMQQNVQTVV